MLSVIIPTYNRADFLVEAIESVLAQDFLNTSACSSSFEFLVVDDGSMDHTREVVESFGQRVKYHYQENKGVGAARNTGLKQTQGEFVAFLDSDDLWKENKISTQMEFMKSHPDAMMCCTEEIWIRHGVFVNPKKKHRKYSGWIFDKVLSLCLLSLSSALFRRRVFDEIGNFDEDFPVCEDYDFGIRLAHRYPIHFLSQPLIVKRGGHSDQLSKKYWGMDRFRVKALEKALQLNLTPQQDEKVKKEIVKKSRILALGFQKRNKMSEVETYKRLIEEYSLDYSYRE